MNWRDSAACLTSDTELFFPIGVTGPAIPQLEEAKRVCAGCPVRAICLDWAIRVGVDHGVWGGLSGEERRSLKRRTRRDEAPQRDGVIARRPAAFLPTATGQSIATSTAPVVVVGHRGPVQ